MFAFFALTIIVVIGSILALVVSKRQAMPFLVLAPVTIGYTTVADLIGVESASTVQKSLILGLTLSAVIVLGWGNHARIGFGVIFTFVITAIFSFTFGGAGDINHNRTFTGLFGYLWPWFLYFAAWSKLKPTVRAAALAWLPLIAFGISAVASATDLAPLARVEWASGEVRLSGTMASAHMAALSMVGVIGSSWLWLQGKRTGLILALIGMLLSAATLTRGALIVAGIVFAAALFTQMRRSGARSIALLLFISAFAAVTLYGLYDSLTSRFDAAGLSGRTVAWSYFWNLFLQKPLAGYGWGSSVELANQSTNPLIREYFIAPHNTYLQLLVEGGVVGATAVLVAIVIACVYAVRRCDPGIRFFVTSTFIGFAVFAAFDNLLVSVQSTAGFVAFTVFVAADSPSERRRHPAASLQQSLSY